MRRKGSLDNNVSFSGFTSCKDKTELQTSVLSTATQSTIDAGASISKSFSEGTITRHQRNAEASTISSGGIPLVHQGSPRRVASLDPALPLTKEIIYPVAGKVELLDDIQSNFKLTSRASYTDKHLMSESSSSNSSHVITPNQSESKSQVELSVETKLGREGNMTGVLQKAFECSLSVDEKNNVTIKTALVGSASLEKGEFLKGAAKQLKLCDEQATSGTSQLSEQLCSVKMKPTESVSPETWHEFKEAAKEEQQLSNLRVTSDQGCGFDLNEDLEGVNELGNAADNSVDESGSYHNEANVSEPIVVMAKVGVPNGLPTVPLQFNGELGWKSVGISAFRPTFTCKNSVIDTGSYGTPANSNSVPSLGPKGFDLNLAPPSEPHAVGSSMEIGVKESERLNLNLNSDEGLKCHARPNSQILSFDLNDNLCIDKDTNSGLHHLGQSSQPKRNNAPIDTINGSASQGNASGIRPAYWVDLSSMPGFTHVQGQPFLVTAPTLYPQAEQKQTLLPLQPNMALTQGPPPSGYYIGTSNGLSSSFYSSNILPHVGGQHGTSISGPLLAAAYPGNLHLMETTQGLNLMGGFTAVRPSFFLNGGVSSSENANRVGNAPAGERVNLSQTVGLPALSEKRKEPDGSWGSYQHNHRRMATWK